MTLTDETRAKLAKLRQLIVDHGPTWGAEYVVKKLLTRRWEGKEVMTTARAGKMLLGYVQKGLLDHGLYQEAANLLWGEDIFTFKPKCVQRIWEKMPVSKKLMIMGAGAMSKSYSVAAWLLLDWIRDPEWTCIKVLSSTGEHAKRNVFAHIKNLHLQSVISLPGTALETSIQANGDDKQGIHLLRIPQGQEGKGRLRGFHPAPRTTPHPQFGTLSRVRAILDEAEEIPEGVWEDVGNMLSTSDDNEHVKVICATNPKDRNSEYGQRCEPVDGWSSVSMEDSQEWTSRLDWTVIRLDGARSENVMERKTVFPGFMSWEGFQDYLRGGDTSPEYTTMARGWFPEQGLSINVIPADYIERSRGIFKFVGRATYVLAVDLGFAEGGDKCVATIGRWGLVSGWTKPDGAWMPIGKTEDGLIIEREVKSEEPRYGLQIESQFEIEKGNTIPMAHRIKATCNALHIKPEWVIVDKTGVGLGVHDTLKVILGHETMGLHFGEAATDKRVCDDDTEKANELYDGVVTELPFAVRRYMEFDFLKIGPGVKLHPLTEQATNRRYRQVKKKLVRVESKLEYKTRTKANSPDEFDSFSLLVHLVRMRSEFTASMLANSERPVVQAAQPGIVDALELINMSEY